MHSKAHWEQVYSTKSENELSWYQVHAELSMKLIGEAGSPSSISVIDVGGGTSRLVDDLLASRYRDITILDIAGTALRAAQTRLGKRAVGIRWIESSVIDAELPGAAYDVWHDRAVFHFLTAAEERQAYVAKVLHAVKPGGLVIVATFAEDGPVKCSGLPVMRYRPEELHREFGLPFELLEHQRETHLTPGGKTQSFVYCLCRRGIC